MLSGSVRSTHSPRTSDQNGQALPGESTYRTSRRLPQVQIGTGSLFWSIPRSDSRLIQPVRTSLFTSPTLSMSGWFPSTTSSIVEPLRAEPVIFRTLTGVSVCAIPHTLLPRITEQSTVDLPTSSPVTLPGFGGGKGCQAPAPRCL